MVNENFNKFNQEQKKHQSPYVSNKTLDNSGNFNKSDYNSQENTDKSVGATGRILD
ncbi:hypothetical protein [Bacillus sp. T3]|uniref:hypothetical protein n=1 Tax=Bacillus sp. T3 TaxID=467262 RepID=UPI002980B7A5|nr:hypothetical protein [Bacillus sp. T3]